jgi:hypothetical protein
MRFFLTERMMRKVMKNFIHKFFTFFCYYPKLVFFGTWATYLPGDWIQSWTEPLMLSVVF